MSSVSVRHVHTTEKYVYLLSNVFLLCKHFLCLLTEMENGYGKHCSVISINTLSFRDFDPDPRPQASPLDSTGSNPQTLLAFQHPRHHVVLENALLRHCIDSHDLKPQKLASFCQTRSSECEHCTDSCQDCYHISCYHFPCSGTYYLKQSA